MRITCKFIAKIGLQNKTSFCALLSFFLWLRAIEMNYLKSQVTNKISFSNKKTWNLITFFWISTWNLSAFTKWFFIFPSLIITCQESFFFIRMSRICIANRKRLVLLCFKHSCELNHARINCELNHGRVNCELNHGIVNCKHPLE